MSELILRQAPENPRVLQRDGTTDSVALDDAMLSRLRAITSQYQRAIANRDKRGLHERLQPPGQALFAWLRECGNWQQALVEPGAALVWHLHSMSNPGGSEGAEIAAVLCNTPWEILADDRGFLARCGTSGFTVLRRLPVQAPLSPPSDYRLSIMFMASSPRGQTVLDYRTEEVAIEQAAGRIGVDLTVEESGELAQLGETLALTRGELEAVDILHLSCHGHHEPQPRLAMETERGATDWVTAGLLWRQVRGQGLRLGLISACHTAAGAAADPSANYAAQLVEYGLPAAVAWGGAVLDNAATMFAEALYGGLSKGVALTEAYVEARNRLVGDHDCQDWHLPRLLLAGNAGGALCRGRGRSRRRINAKAFAERAYLGHNRQVPIATFEEFVGRRRELQRAIAALRDGQGVLLHGPGHLGKSSLAGRLTRRFADHHHVVVYGSTPASQVLRAIGAAYQRPKMTAAVQRVISTPATGMEHWRDGLQQLLEVAEEVGKPMLLVLDDFEKLLDDPDDPKELHRIKAPAVDLIAGILAAFAAHSGASRLVITSRYDFAAIGLPQDDTGRLERIQLTPFDPQDHERQLARLLQLWQEAPSPLSARQLDLLKQTLPLASGNPGLLRKLTDFVRTDAAGAPALLQEVKAYLDEGRQPTDSRVGDYLETLAIDRMLGRLSMVENMLLSLSKSLDLPVPVEVMQDIANAALGAADGASSCHRLLSFGLWDVHYDLCDPHRFACAINTLAEPRVKALADVVQMELEKSLLPLLQEAWTEQRCPSACDLMLLKIAVRIGEPDRVTARAESGLQLVLSRNEFASGHALAEVILPYILKPPYNLLRIAGELAIGAGEVQDAERLFSEALSGVSEPSSKADADAMGALIRAEASSKLRQGRLDEASLQYYKARELFQRFGLEHEEAIATGEIADIMQSRGDLDEALRIRTEEELPVYERLGDVRSIAITKGKIADIMQSRGDLDEALRIRTEEELPVYERLGDVRSIAITKGKIADIMQSRGDLDEALRIRTEEELPVLERLGDVREIAITKGKIADIMQSRGDLDEALRIRTEEELPVYERLGDVRSIAITKGQIADIMQSRGDLDEALRIRTEEELPVLERLGDVREIAITKGQIADIMQSRGDLDEALRIRTEEELPVLERLGDVRSIAITKGKIADIMQSRGDLDEALRIRTEEELPVYERLGDVRSIAITKGKIADIMQSRGDLDEALRIRTEEELPVLERLGDVREIAITKGKIADIMQSRGDLDEALRIRTEEELPVYERLGDVRSIAITKGKIADIMQSRGDLDEALRIRTEEELPVLERLGDVRSIAITKGQIADIMQSRGDLDEALRIRTEEELPVYERLGDVREMAAAQNSLFDLYWQKEEYQKAYEAISQAFDLVRQLGIPDGISAVGIKLGQVLMLAEQTEAAQAVLTLSRDAFAKLGRAEGVERAEALLARLSSA